MKIRNKKLAILVAPIMLLLFAQAARSTRAEPQETLPAPPAESAPSEEAGTPLAPADLAAPSEEAGTPAEAPSEEAGTPLAPADLAGDWAGTLDVGAAQLRLVLKVEAGEDGTVSAILDSVDQGAKIPIDSVSVEGRTVRFSIAAIAGSFEGALDAAAGAIEGTWTQGGRSFPLTLEKTEEPFELNRPQTPEPPFPYASREVTFENEADGVTLAGTLLTPDGEGPFPAVLFVSGSGPQDRNETLMAHQPFLILADHLARHGIASLRYDDRGVGESTGDHMGSTVTDFAEDAAAGVAFLADQPKIDGDVVGILGHSEGGLAGPQVAAAGGAVDFLVLLAPPGVPLVELLQRQSEDMLRLQGLDETMLEAAIAQQAEDLALVRDESVSDEALQAELLARTRRRIEAMGPEEAARLGLDEAQAGQAIAQATTAWFRSLMRQDPAVHLRKVEVPVLALFGGKDVQVAAEENAAALREARPDAEIRTFPDLNHLFQHAETGGLEEYGKIEETIAPEVLAAVTEWITERGRAGG
jgi:uncharacterized protein